MTDNLMFVLSAAKLHTNTLDNKKTTIVLPKIWLEHHNLKDGDSVSLKVDEDKNLVITPNPHAK